MSTWLGYCVVGMYVYKKQLNSIGFGHRLFAGQMTVTEAFKQLYALPQGAFALSDPSDDEFGFKAFEAASGIPPKPSWWDNPHEDGVGGFYDLYFISPFRSRYEARGITPIQLGEAVRAEWEQPFFTFWRKRFIRWLTRCPSDGDMLWKAAKKSKKSAEKANKVFG